ncbi:7-deoxyloganetic acid glucosyltransferase [Vitis vinifera]|uniref:7-deoxyloganetic acid glucosyltransferase n=1 Tax=Vitis vinifera TaxID=29760 RepID=A0A438FL59_VITVI|nr:7-deoxyloganetic acid glucosyltransferase [Vitis vinifera]
MISRGQGSDTRPPVSCIIADGMMSFTIDIANEVGIPIISFRTVSACSFWAYFSALKLIESGELPLKGLPSESTTSQSSNSFRQEDRSCIAWLDHQPSKSVIYPLLVGHTDGLSCEEDGEHQTPAELMEGAKERSYIVEWAPQEEVLAHPAVDQQINSRFVSHVWKLGSDMKDTCDRLIVEKMVRDLMEERKDELLETADMMATRARKCVSEGGSSYCNLSSLIEEIRLMGA